MRETIWVSDRVQAKLSENEFFRGAHWIEQGAEKGNYIFDETLFSPFYCSINNGIKNIIAFSPDILHTMDIIIVTQN